MASFLTMEFILHFMYVVAIKDEHAWSGFSPAQISMIGFWNLIVVWLKVSSIVLRRPNAHTVRSTHTLPSAVTHPLEVFPTVGDDGWNLGTRKHDQVHG